MSQHLHQHPSSIRASISSAGQQTEPLELVTSTIPSSVGPIHENQETDVIVLAGRAFLHLFLVLLAPLIYAVTTGWLWSFLLAYVGVCFLIAFCQLQQPRKGIASMIIAIGASLLLLYF